MLSVYGDPLYLNCICLIYKPLNLRSEPCISQFAYSVNSIDIRHSVIHWLQSNCQVSACFRQFILGNLGKFTPEEWLVP